MLPGLTGIAGMVGGGGPESHDSYTSLICHFDDGLTDSSDFENDFTAVGDAAVSATQSKFGLNSLGLDGAGDCATIAATLPTELLFRTGSWTIDYCIWFNAVTANKGHMELGSYVNGIYIRQNSSSVVDIYINNSSNAYSWTPSINTWYHLEWSSDGTNIKFFVDGTQNGSDWARGAIDINPTALFRLGAIDGGGQAHNGFMDEVRISKGIQRHTTDFTPETSPYG